MSREVDTAYISHYVVYMVVISCGPLQANLSVNGAGKSTNLAKVAYYRQHNGESEHKDFCVEEFNIDQVQTERKEAEKKD